ncbi:MAG: phosphoribosyl-AMP cyclohydrolase [Deltaproteobacteria bacterium]|jgi:phosphoribosyl-AMP cyclohydrolase|nr:phosphoribosyl-AMP cyclohydrolase [Deltaproteobacteria bacterium]
MPDGDAPREMRPDFRKGGGLVPAIAQDAETGDVLMVAYMNEESYDLTLSTGEVHYWSRSRSEIWHKGATSGNIQKVREIRLDCDRDAVLVKIRQVGGAACHTGKRSCFHYLFAGGNTYETLP